MGGLGSHRIASAVVLVLEVKTLGLRETGNKLVIGRFGCKSSLKPDPKHLSATSYSRAILDLKH